MTNHQEFLNKTFIEKEIQKLARLIGYFWDRSSGSTDLRKSGAVTEIYHNNLDRQI